MKNTKVKFIIDTNVFINGIVFPEKHIADSDTLDILFNLIENNAIELVFSQDTIGELVYIMKNNLLHNFKNKEEQIQKLNILMILFLNSYSVNIEHINAPICNDRKDDMFLQCVVKGRVSYLITNDFNSGMHDVEGLNCQVLSARDFVGLYNNGQIEIVEQEVASGVIKNTDNKEMNKDKGDNKE